MATRKQLLEKLKSEMPPNLNEIQKAAFIAVFVADQVDFDEHWWWGNKDERKKVYEKAKREATQTNSEGNKVRRKLICVTITSLYVYLAKQMGLDVAYCVNNVAGNYKGIYRNQTFISKLKASQHIAPVVNIPKRGYIKVDVQEDLYNLQTRCRTKKFGTKSEDEIGITDLSSSEIDETLRSINYVDERYTDDYINDLKQQNKELSLVEQYEKIITDKNLIRNVRKCGCVAASRFYKKILESMSKGKKGGGRAILDFFVCYSKQREYTFGIYGVNAEKNWIYIFSKKSRQMVRSTPLQVQYLFDRGIRIQDRPGAKQFTRFVEKQVKELEKATKIQDQDKVIDIEGDLMYDDDEIQI